MKTLFAFLLILISVVCDAQTFDVINWSMEGELHDGLVIKTQIPLDNNLHFPMVTIEGYDNGRSAAIALKVSWTLEEGQFSNATVSSSGGLTPDVALGQKNGLIQIYLKMWGANTRLHITAFAKGANESASWFTNWSINADEPFEGSNQKIALYHNEFKGDVQMETLNSETAAINKASVGELSVDHVKGNLTVKGPVVEAASVEGQVLIKGQDGGIEIESGDDEKSYIDFKGSQNILSDYQGRILYSDLSGFEFSTGGPGMGTNPGMRIDLTGTMIIGSLAATTASAAVPYKLYVGGGIRTRKVKVDQVNWPDYVFEPEYKLRSLSSLEAFIKANKHLPDLPSADEVGKEGVDIGETQAALLKKVEELTMYIIEQNKNQEKLTEQFKTQQMLIKKQQQMLLQIKKQFK